MSKTGGRLKKVDIVPTDKFKKYEGHVEKRYKAILKNPNSSKADIRDAKNYFERSGEAPHDPTVVEDGITPFEGFLANRIMEIFTK
jgi:hypothetical protein|tara:strand:+ start:363 stop:620 length:258 start_codon:yes stop_codon:yes gene_type:complete